MVFRARTTRYNIKQGDKEYDVVLNPDTVTFLAAGATYQMKCSDTTQEDIELSIRPETLGTDLANPVTHLAAALVLTGGHLD